MENLAIRTGSEPLDCWYVNLHAVSLESPKLMSCDRPILQMHHERWMDNGFYFNIGIVY